MARRLSVWGSTAAIFAGVVIAVPLAPIGAVAAAAGGATQPGSGCAPLTSLGAKSIPLSQGRAGTAVTFAADAGLSVASVQVPEGWSPLTASDPDLESLGFPARPSVGPALAEWQATYQNFKGNDPLVSNQVCKGTRKHGQIGTKPSGNYVGLEETNATYKQAYGTFALPATNVLVCPSASAAAFWVGTTDNSTIDQGGIDLDPRNDTGYQFWEELFPLNPYFSNNGNDMPWKAGQSVQVSESYATDSGGHFTIQAYNKSTGYIYSLSYTNASSYYRSANAEFVSEKVAGYYERKFGTVSWSGAYVVTSDGVAHYPGSPSYWLYTAPFATQGTPSGSSFAMTWKAC